MSADNDTSRKRSLLDFRNDIAEYRRNIAGVELLQCRELLLQLGAVWTASRRLRTFTPLSGSRPRDRRFHVKGNQGTGLNLWFVSSVLNSLRETNHWLAFLTRVRWDEIHGPENPSEGMAIDNHGIAAMINSEMTSAPM